MQFAQLKRRDFITLLGGMAALPLAVRAQKPERVRRIIMLMGNAENDPNGKAYTDAFRQSLQELGWTEGRNVRIDYRWAAGKPDRANAYAAELATLAPDVVLANGTQVLTALQRATRSIPIVFVVVADPVGAGFVKGLSHPGGDITGFSTFEPEIGGKWLELLKEIKPDLQHIAGIWEPAFKGFANIWHAIESSALKLNVQITSISLRDPTDDIEPVLAAFARKLRAGLIVLPTPANASARNRIFSLAARYRLPAVYPFRYYATGGGLISYGFDTLDLYRRSASYVDRILKGERPADLPVQAPTKYELVINLKTAKTLGLTVPQSLLVRADAVIE
jgi:putative ABC transport system substrate-binding protein